MTGDKMEIGMGRASWIYVDLVTWIVSNSEGQESNRCARSYGVTAIMCALVNK